MASVVFATAAVRPITNQAWEAFGQYIPCIKLGVIFMFVCSPYYFLWLSKISITLGSGTENVLWTPEAHILFYFYSSLWWLHYSLMCEFSPRLFFSLLLSSVPSSFGFPIYLVQLHGSELVPWLGFPPLEQSVAPGLLHFTDQSNESPPLPVRGWASRVLPTFLFFSRKDMKT